MITGACRALPCTRAGGSASRHPLQGAQPLDPGSARFTRGAFFCLFEAASKTAAARRVPRLAWAKFPFGWASFSWGLRNGHARSASAAMLKNKQKEKQQSFPFPINPD